METSVEGIYTGSNPSPAVRCEHRFDRVLSNEQAGVPKVGGSQAPPLNIKCVTLKGRFSLLQLCIRHLSSPRTRDWHFHTRLRPTRASGKPNESTSVWRTLDLKVDGLALHFLGDENGAGDITGDATHILAEHSKIEHPPNELTG